MYTYNTRVRYSESGADKKMTIAAIVNYLQDASTFQSEDLGLGVDYLWEKHIGWVINFWQIQIDRYPVFGENLTIGTIPYELKGFLGKRNFCMMDEKGEMIVKANSIWSLLNMDTGRPTNVTQAMLDNYNVGGALDMEYTSRKITVPEGGVPQEPIRIGAHHLDTNHHVNNGQYITMAMAYLPEDFVTGQLRAEYRQQGFLGAVITPVVVQNEAGDFVISLNDEKGKAYAVVEFAAAKK